MIMEITRLNADRQTMKEIDDAYCAGEIREEDYNSIMEETASKDFSEAIREIGAGWYDDIMFAVPTKGKERYYTDLNDIIDMIVRKDLTYIARADGRPCVVREDDGEIFLLFSEEEAFNILKEAR